MLIVPSEIFPEKWSNDLAKNSKCTPTRFFFSKSKLLYFYTLEPHSYLPKFTKVPFTRSRERGLLIQAQSLIRRPNLCLMGVFPPKMTFIIITLSTDVSNMHKDLRKRLLVDSENQKFWFKVPPFGLMRHISKYLALQLFLFSKKRNLNRKKC